MRKKILGFVFAAAHGRRNTVRIRRLYRPATTPVDQSTVTGP